MTSARARAVRFDRYGGRDVLYIAEVPMPTAADGEVVVESGQRASIRARP